MLQSRTQAQERGDELHSVLYDLKEFALSINGEAHVV
jgi:hypothetical protein